jgi:CheY-like chemotaxis protein
MPESRRPSRPPLVLIANDQEWAARSVESILEPSGYAVLRAYNGRQAFDLACSARPDLVMLDYRLPDTDGVEVCRRLR